MFGFGKTRKSTETTGEACAPDKEPATADSALTTAQLNGAPQSDEAPQNANAPDQKPDDAGREEIINRFTLAIGKCVSVLMRSPAHRHFSIADVDRLLSPAVLTNQFSLVTAKSEKKGHLGPCALILWAEVSDEIHEKLKADYADTCPIKPDEWKSGANVWIMEVAGQDKIVEATVLKLQQTRFGGRSLNVRLRSTDTPAISLETVEAVAAA
ncbi:MAG: toxin-activating lysine-acyltransferase [Hyphomicrobiaceae bacterium]